MAASKLASLAAVLAATVAVGISIQQWATLRAATVELESARGAADLLHQQIIRVEGAAPKDLAPTPSRPRTPPPLNAMDVYFEAERAKGDAFLAAHPEVRAVLTTAQRARLRGRFFPLYRDLKLSEEQITEFESIMLTQGGKVWPNAGSLWLGERLNPEQCDARLRAALGEEKFARLKAEYLAGGETIAQKLAARLAWSDEPLPPAAGSAVRDAIDATYVPGKGVDWDRALAELQPVLSDRQLAALRDLTRPNASSMSRPPRPNRGNTMRATLWICLTIGIIALTWAWRERKQTHAVEAATRETRAEIIRLTRQRATLQRMRAMPAASIQPTAALASPSSSTPVTEKTLSDRMLKDSEARRAALSDSPSLQVLYQRHQEAYYRLELAALFRRRKLTPGQQDAVVSAIATWDTTARDLETIAKQKGLSRKDPGLKAQYAEADATLMRGIGAVLGSDAKQTMQEYTRLDRARNYITSCGGMLSLGAAPLTPDQMEALTNAIDQCSKQPTRDPIRIMTSAEWQQFEARAQGILTPDQWRVLQSATPAGTYSGPADTAVNELLTTIAGPNR